VHNIDHNDILVVGTDGLFDNLYDEQIKELIMPFLQDSNELADVQRVADVIADKAEQYGADPKWNSPFAAMAERYNYLI